MYMECVGNNNQLRNYPTAWTKENWHSLIRVNKNTFPYTHTHTQAHTHTHRTIMYITDDAYVYIMTNAIMKNCF